MGFGGGSRGKQRAGALVYPGAIQVKAARVAITSAQLLAMFATPVQILAAPGANLAIIIDAIVFVMIASGTAYASGGAVTFQYHGGVAAHAGSVPASVVNGGAGTVVTQLGPSVGANGLTVPSNTGLDITNATGAFTTGTGTAIVTVNYWLSPTA